ncbi:MAG: hypothetical protein R3C28_29825 [Pirellulaceae bacterium]
MDSVNDNPFESPQSETNVRPTVSNQKSTGQGQLFTLPLMPWRINFLSANCLPLTAIVLGHLSLTLQLGLWLAVLFHGIGEPYQDLQECLLELGRTAPFCVGLAGAFLLPMIPALGGKTASTRRMLLVPWGFSLLSIPLLVCCSCGNLASPHYGILNDNRPAWMTHPVVLLWGHSWAWIGSLFVYWLASVTVERFGQRHRP